MKNCHGQGEGTSIEEKAFILPFDSGLNFCFSLGFTKTTKAGVRANLLHTQEAILEPALLEEQDEWGKEDPQGFWTGLFSFSSVLDTQEAQRLP